MSSTEVSPAVAVRRLSNAKQSAAIVTAAAELGVADAVGDAPTDVGELAALVGAEPNALGRLMRALAALGIFRQVEPGRYEHTPMSRALREDAPARVVDTVLTGSSWGWTTWGRLTDAVRTGEPIFSDEYGTDFFTYLAQNPEDQARMFRGMTTWSDPMNVALVRAMRLDAVRSVADMGSGRGTLLRTMLEQVPHLSGIWFDTEPTLAVADEELRAGPLSERCRFVCGDFFTEVPFVSDAYVFKLTLHMYEDGPCEQILRNCVAAARPGARIIIADPVLTDPPQNAFVPTMDLHMLLVMGGRERTERDYAELFHRVGLTFAGITPTGVDLQVIEATVPS